ncbi:MAG: CDP-glucose 4,6-dehydratase [Clostridiales bacterium]|nr:CDP-glucose 4,6-dehydratase [Clostridiales bacterium]
MDARGFWKGRRVFVTGHTGFKGAWLCKILEYVGADVTGYALAPEDKTNLFNICKPRMRSVIGDIRDFDALLDAYKSASPDAVIHMAAQPLVLRGYREPRYTYETNVMGTINLLECARLWDSAGSILNVTTDKVYFNRETERGYREEETLDGHDPYANSKSCSELVTASYIRSFFEKTLTAVSTARSGNVIGGGDFAENRIIPDCAKAAAAGERIKIRNPQSVRPYQHVLDTLFGYLLIMQRQYKDYFLAGSYNIGPDTDGCATSGELADMFCEAWGDGAGWDHIPTENPHESGLLKLNCDKIKERLGWAPRWDIKASVTATARWYKAYYGDGANNIMNDQIEMFLEPAL